VTEGGTRGGPVLSHLTSIVGRRGESTRPNFDIFPFATADRILKDVAPQVKVRICDAHCEASSEKIALGHFLDGRCSLVFGTHTHIPTADAKVTPAGTAYISDVGMTGPYDSVLGRRKDRVLHHMTTALPTPFDVATNDIRLCGVLAEVDETTGKATSIERIEIGKPAAVGIRTIVAGLRGYFCEDGCI